MNCTPAYTLENLSEKQAQTLVDALDLYSRIRIGQLEMLTEMARMGEIPHKEALSVSESIARAEQADVLMREVKNLMTGLAMNASFGILGEKAPEAARVAWDMKKSIRHRLAWDRQPEGGMGVDFDDPSLLHSTPDPIVSMKPIAECEEDRLEALPEECFVGRHNQGWRVLRLGENGKIDVISEATELKTTIQKAVNAIKGVPRRHLTF